jgi:hypothetical protein
MLFDEPDESVPCYVCQQPSSGTCMRCNKPYCEEHGGGRLCMPRNRLALFPSIRPVCDRCTPNQLWLFLQPFVVLIIGLLIVLGLVYLLSKRS